ncbi:piggyBac transposable element-derived protein 4-like [Halichondria panicea]|uniref:piggyBac transposable element-derived protein 4-like n=1 Tax=Halichondria panicea TaxID=6063 RepID=UPI00312B736E
MLEYIVTETNKYADQSMTPLQHEKWIPLTLEELKAYIGFCILMGVVTLPSIEDYWKKDTLLHYSPIASKISRDRFRDIRRYLHFADNTTLPTPGTPGSDRLAKVRPLINKVNERCSAVYLLDRDVAVDEAMIKFQGRSSLKQYLPNKPVKRGIKVWVLADSKNGYFHTMQVYTGRQGTPEKHLGTRVVKDLTTSLKGKYHHVYFDNYFTSLNLLEDLEKDGIYACGTTRSNRVGFPVDLKDPSLPDRYINDYYSNSITLAYLFQRRLFDEAEGHGHSDSLEGQ